MYQVQGSPLDSKKHHAILNSLLQKRPLVPHELHVASFKLQPRVPRGQAIRPDAGADDPALDGEEAREHVLPVPRAHPPARLQVREEPAAAPSLPGRRELDRGLLGEEVVEGHDQPPLAQARGVRRTLPLAMAAGADRHADARVARVRLVRVARVLQKEDGVRPHLRVVDLARV